MNIDRFETSLNATIEQFIVIFVVLAIISVVLKGIGLWKSARNEDKWWFVAMMVINSLGILPIYYIVTHPEKRASKKK